MMLQKWLLVFFLLTSLASAGPHPYAAQPGNHQILIRKYYELSYNSCHEVANWVAYSMDHNTLRGCYNRSDSFRPDPQVRGGSATLSDYLNSGFDRGHLVPAGDMKFDRQAMHETFLLSNITPQPANFNRGRWSSLELLMRAWALRYKKIWIVTGPILRNGLTTIGRENTVSVPDEYFKVVLRKEGNGYKGIGFIMPVDVPYSQLTDYVVSIDEVEKHSGIDFFSILPDSQEAVIERADSTSGWDFRTSFNYLPCLTSVAQ